MTNDGHFCFRQVHGLKLLYHMVGPNVYQLVIPQSGGLQQLLLQELHSTSYVAHLGVRKTTSALVERIW